MVFRKERSILRGSNYEPKKEKKMRYAETGYNLEIDLAKGNIERVETDPKLTELHLG